jgi:hypothetical protein
MAVSGTIDPAGLGGGPIVSNAQPNGLFGRAVAAAPGSPGGMAAGGALIRGAAHLVPPPAVDV